MHWNTIFVRCDANDGQEADTILQDRIADLEAALFSANSTIEWKETEIEILLSEVHSLRMNVDGTLESLYVSLQSDYRTYHHIPTMLTSPC